MKKLFVLLLLIPSLLQAVEKVDVSNPYRMLAQVADTTFSRIKNEKVLTKTQAEQSAELEKIVDQEMLPYVDYKYAAYKVIGQHLKNTTKDQRNRFVNAFRSYLIASYAQAMTNYDDQTVKIQPAKEIKETEKFVTVKVLITAAGRSDIHLDFQARKLKDNAGWKVYDMTAEGVSLLSTKKSELGGLIRKQGIDAVIELLEKRQVDTNINTNKKAEKI